MTSTATARAGDVNKVSGSVVDAAMAVHTALGPGLLESAYEACLAHELRKRGFRVESQVALPVVYDGVRLDLGYRLHLVVNRVVIVSIKAVEAISPVHPAQILSYLNLSGFPGGLPLNFHEAHLKDGI